MKTHMSKPTKVKKLNLVEMQLQNNKIIDRIDKILDKIPQKEKRSSLDIELILRIAINIFLGGLLTYMFGYLAKILWFIAALGINFIISKVGERLK